MAHNGEAAAQQRFGEPDFTLAGKGADSAQDNHLAVRLYALQ